MNFPRDACIRSEATEANLRCIFVAIGISLETKNARHTASLQASTFGGTDASAEHWKTSHSRKHFHHRRNQIRASSLLNTLSSVTYDTAFARKRCCLSIGAKKRQRQMRCHPPIYSRNPSLPSTRFFSFSSS